MNIKQKKQLNLPQLIEWGWENEVVDKDLLSDNTTTPLRINNGGEFIFNNDYVYSKNDTFTVEVEEEITEDTVIPKMLEMSFDAYQNVVIDIQVNHSINMVKENAEVLTLHIINDDGTHTLIWRDGKLVE